MSGQPQVFAPKIESAIGTFLASRVEAMERLVGSPIEIKVRATTVDTVQGIASTTDGLAYVQVRAMLFPVEVL